MKVNLWKPSGMFLPGIIPVPPLAKTSVTVEALHLVGQACAESVSFPLLYKIFMFSPRYMRPASAISWGCWLRPGGHSSNVDNLGKIFSHSKQRKAERYVPHLFQNKSPAGERCKLGMSWPSVDKHLCFWSIRCEELCANNHPEAMPERIHYFRRENFPLIDDVKRALCE